MNAPDRFEGEWQAAPPETGPGGAATRLLHISDTHFGTEQPEVVEALLQLCREQRPTLAVLSGDVTQRARPAEFEAASRFMAKLAVPHRLVLPGNHDIPLFDLPRRLMHPYTNYQHAFGYQLEPFYRDDDWLVITVNTTRWYRHKNGELDPVQISSVAERLRQATPRQVRVVVTHHPLAVVEEGDQVNQPLRCEQALAAWAEAGVDLVLGGHIHLPYVTPVEPLGEVGTVWPPSTADAVDSGLPLPPRPRRVWAVQAGTATSTRIREGIPNSVNLISSASQHFGRVCEIETWQFDLQQGVFACVSRRSLALSE